MGILNDRIKKNNEIPENGNPLYPPFPKKNFLIEITNICNHQCIFCANQKMIRPKGFINDQFLQRILLEAYALGTREVGFYTVGEPFVCDQLHNYVLMAKDIGYEYVYITTNGALAVPEKSKKVIDAGLDSIKFSINAATRDTYKFVHGKDDFNTVMQNIKFIHEYRKQSRKKYNIFISSIQTSFTEGEEAAFAQTFSPYCDEIVFIKAGNQGGLMPEVEKHLTDYAYERADYCKLPFNFINISYEGYLTACCTDFHNSLAVADLNETSLSDAWYSEKLVNQRKALIENLNNNSLCYLCQNNLQGNFTPLDSSLAYNVSPEELFNDNKVENRIIKYMSEEK